MKTTAIDDDVQMPTAAKRQKVNHESPHEPAHNAGSIRCVLADDLCRPVPLETVVCAQLAKQSDISTTMRALMSRLPLPVRLQHLKRVRHDRRIVLFAQREFDSDNGPNGSNAASLTDRTKRYLLDKLIEPAIIDLLCIVSEHQVAAVAPTLRWQFSAANVHWPCKFHPDQATEARYNNTVFNTAQTTVHEQNARIVRLVSDHVGQPTGIAVDPRNGRIVAVGCAESADTHPLMHSAMVLIDAVARSQLAGAWNDWPVPGRTVHDEGDRAHATANDTATRTCTDGIASPIRALIASSFPLAKFGAQQPISKKTGDRIVDAANDEDSVCSGDNLSKYGPYLGTGYDVYLSEEPCMLCAMALVHSRVRTVFYERPMANGALGSLAKLHTLRALNHHYEVYRICTDSTSEI